MHRQHYSALYFASVVSLGGFLFGFDASVISGVIGFIVPQFGLNDWQLGLVVGALNPVSVSLDLLWLQFELPLGQALLAGFAIGLITGVAFMYVFRVLPARHRLRKAQNQLTRLDPPPREDTPGTLLPDD